MLRALYELDIAPDLLVATSAGALNAAFVASRPQTVETAHELGCVWRGLQRGHVFPVNPWVLVGGLLGKRDHLVPGGALRGLMRRHLQLDDLGDAAIPLHVVAFDLDQGREVLLSHGPALDAVAGAASIPGVLPPVDFGARRLVDGGIVNNTPISHAVELGAERIYVLPTQDLSPAQRQPPPGALAAAIGGIGLLVGRRFEHDLRRYAADAELIVLPAPNPLQVQPTDFGQAGRLISDGFAAARQRLAQPLRAASPGKRLRATG
jgi:NTE family protein